MGKGPLALQFLLLEKKRFRKTPKTLLFKKKITHANQGGSFVYSFSQIWHLHSLLLDIKLRKWNCASCFPCHALLLGEVDQRLPLILERLINNFEMQWNSDQSGFVLKGKDTHGTASWTTDSMDGPGHCLWKSMPCCESNGWHLSFKHLFHLK